MRREVYVFVLLPLLVRLQKCSESLEIESTSNLESIFKSVFVGRCNNYIHVVEQNNCDIQKSKIDCDLIWEVFSNATLRNDSCQVTIKSFDRLMELAVYPVQNDTTVFWSGTKGFAHRLSKALGYSTLEDTLMGYIMHDLPLCLNNRSWLNTTCANVCVNYTNPFWNAASINFARRAKGRAMVVLNGTKSRGGAISNRSTFMSHELPNLRVTEMRILLVSGPDEERFETCSQPKTLGYLEARLNEMNIKYVCHDDYLVDSVDMRLLMCTHKLDKACNTVRLGQANTSSHVLGANFINLIFIYIIIKIFV